mmetsp:Transcript_8647/g.12917  ORF Transcript_8647/g.12917 Transcript_8647/m.12917 type:complete len:92 (-) Transcript_8647:1-276(-)
MTQPTVKQEEYTALGFGIFLILTLIVIGLRYMYTNGLLIKLGHCMGVDLSPPPINDEMFHVVVVTRRDDGTVPLCKKYKKNSKIPTSDDEI